MLPQPFPGDHSIVTAQGAGQYCFASQRDRMNFEEGQLQNDTDQMRDAARHAQILVKGQHVIVRSYAEGTALYVKIYRPITHKECWIGLNDEYIEKQ